ncbi:MAG: lactonase family protein [Verrucomicrobiota bacterium]
MKPNPRFLGMFPKLITPFFLLSVPLYAVPVYIGTNTGGNSGSKGIYLADFDSATGKLTEPALAAEYKNPGFLALHPAKPILYACGQPNKDFADGTNSVAAFTIGSDHGLKFLGEASVGGKGACHVAVDKTGGTVAIANYGDGSFSTVNLGADGIPGELATVISTKGSGPNKNRQQGPHAHGVYFDAANKHLLVPDLGLDKVFVHPFDAATSKLGEPVAPLTTAPGAGPRHLTFSPDGKNAYVINELDNSVLSTSYDGGKFKVLGTVPTLPADFTGGSTTAEIEVHPNGKFVYGSNRGHNSIVVYQRDGKTGELKFLQHAPCGGKTPRHFKIDPSGKWLLCGHQDSNTISVLPLDPATGLLGAPVNTVSSPSPICLLFVP